MALPTPFVDSDFGSGHSFVGGEWATDLPRVCRPLLFSLGILQKTRGWPTLPFWRNAMLFCIELVRPAMFSRKGLLLQRFLNSGIAGVPQVECSLSRDEFALGHRLNLKRSKKGLIIYLVCLGKRFLLDSLS